MSLSWLIGIPAGFWVGLTIAQGLAAYAAGRDRRNNTLGQTGYSQARFVGISVMACIAGEAFVQGILSIILPGVYSPGSVTGSLGTLAVLAFALAVAGIVSGIGRRGPEGRKRFLIGLLFAALTAILAIGTILIVEATLGVLRLPFIG